MDSNDEKTSLSSPKKDAEEGKPIRRTILRDEIRRRVIERILDGTYPPGSRVVESKLAREFGTSQAPAREALRDLAGMNLIESLPHKGARVRALDPNHLRQVYPVRAALEALAGREAALNVNDELISALTKQLEKMREATQQGDLNLLTKYDLEFHEIIVTAANNEVLLRMWRSLHLDTGTFINVTKLDLDLNAIAEQHATLVEAIKSGDSTFAENSMRAHIEYFGAMLYEE